MKHMTRRSFLKGSMLTAAALSLPARSWANVDGANEAIRFAVVGTKGRGRALISDILKLNQAGENVRITAICDVDREVLASTASALRQQGIEVEQYVDIREMLESRNIDAVSMATPNHWHSLATIWAVQSGRDVYIEKPVSHNVWEGRKMVEAARKYRRIVQTGTQSRSSSGIAEAIEWLKEGHIGKIRFARGLCYKPRQSIGKVNGPQPIPESIDYDLWCGPAPKAPLMRRQLHYDWHWVWDTGNGDLGNQGIHQMDIARWFLGENALSPRVFSVGGRLGYIDDGETPNTQFVYHDYKTPLIFEVRGLPERAGSKRMDRYPREHGGSVAVIIECEGGHVLVPDYNGAAFFDANGTKIKEFRGSSNHHGNFVKAVRSRNHKDLTADILEGHLSSALCHTGNISYRVGRQASVQEAREAFKGDREALSTFDRMAAHLVANEVDLEVDKLTLGAFLKMDPQTEQFTNNRMANTLLARDYRAPFVVPVNV